MRKLLLFLLLMLMAPLAVASVPAGTCSGGVMGSSMPGNQVTRGACQAKAAELAPTVRNPPQYSLASCMYDADGSSNRDEWMAAGNSNGSSSCTIQWGNTIGVWQFVANVQCPAGQVENQTGTGCVPDPVSVCASRAGQSVTVTWTKGTASDKLVSDGCQVRMTGISVCVDLSSASPKCGGSGVFTGAVAPAGGVDASGPLPPPPANPKVTPGSTSSTTTGTTGGPPGVTTTTTKTGDLTESYSVNTLTSTATLTAHQAGTTTTVVNNVVVNNGPATESTTKTTETTGESTTKTDTLSFGVQGTGWGAGTSTGNGDGKSTGSTETTTTYPDGSTTGTCEGPACATSPNKPSTGEYGSSASCASEPWCKGDPVQCAQAREAWRTMCEIRRQSERIFGTEKENADAKAQLLQEKVDTKEELQDRVGVTEFDLSDYATFDETLFQASSACPSDKPLSIFGTTVVVSYGPFCDLADLVRPLVVLIATFFATTILYRSLASKG